MNEVVLVHPAEPSARLRFGIQLVADALAERGYLVRRTTQRVDALDGARVLIGVRGASEDIRDLEAADVLLYNTGAPAEEGFYLAALPGRITVVTGGGESGVLYGCQELAAVVAAAGEIPRDLDRGENPQLVLRGPAIGLQKTTVEPPRQVYEYPITRSRFPWFYDRTTWTDLLDLLFSQRANVIYLWSGHPFASLVRVPGYPEAQEVSGEELAENQELLTWLTAEADRRGIWIVLKFYNIHIPLPFAEYHGIPLHQPAPTDLTRDYTRKAIAAFVARYPNVGLYVCLGEVLQGDIYGTEWFVDTILAGVRDAVGDAPAGELPPVIVRNHAIDLQPVLAKALAVYPRLFTEAKFNGESLTTWNPRGKWQEIHRSLAAQGSLHIVNIHILANLEPFRFGAVSFIQKSALAITHRLESHGLHLYPLFYWEWPLTPDRVEPRLRQIDRDGIWFAAWLRYAWRADRDPAAERGYWSAVLAERFGSVEAGKAALDAYEAMGQVAPRLIRRLGITEGNRQTFSLGMTMSQLTNPSRHRPWADLWDAHAPSGERIEEYARREAAGLAHSGETPLSVIDDATHFAVKAADAIARARVHVGAENDEFERLATDAAAIGLLAEFYRLRVLAAVDIATYRERTAAGNRPAMDALDRAADLIDQSVGVYARLADLTDRTYLYANSMQTPQRKVPFPDGAAYAHWRQCLPLYEEEAANFRANLRTLRAGETPGFESGEKSIDRFVAAGFEVTAGNVETFTLRPGESIFTDVDSNIREVAPELEGLTGIRLTRDESFAGQVTITFRIEQPARVLVGYFQNRDPLWLQVPDLETDTHADARGGLEPVLRSAVGIDFLPAVNVHAFEFEAGEHTLALGKGAYFVAGVVSHDQQFTGRDVLGDVDTGASLDWLCEEVMA